MLGAVDKMGLPWDAYYVLTKAEARLTNSQLHPNTGTPDYNIKHDVSDISDIDTSYLKIDGSNANQEIDIGSENLTTTGTITAHTINAITVLNVNDGISVPIFQFYYSAGHVLRDASNNKVFLKGYASGDLDLGQDGDVDLSKSGSTTIVKGNLDVVEEAVIGTSLVVNDDALSQEHLTLKGYSPGTYRASGA